MSNLAARIETCGESIARLSRLSDVPARRIYVNDGLTPEERARLEAVLDDLAAGKIAPRRSRVTVPA